MVDSTRKGLIWNMRKRHKGVNITFIGWTGSGIPNTTPVTTLNRPEKTSVVEREIDPFAARVIISGSNVPRSPSAPETSANGELRIVSTLFREKRLIFDRNCIISHHVMQVRPGYRIVAATKTSDLGHRKIGT
jgi:hypothetical protein